MLCLKTLKVALRVREGKKIMRHLFGRGLLVILLLISVGAIWADPFDVCPAFTPLPVDGSDAPYTQCSALITINPDGTQSVAFNVTETSPDREDSYVGVTNNSSTTVFSVFISGTEPFDFEVGPSGLFDASGAPIGTGDFNLGLTQDSSGVTSGSLYGETGYV